MAPNVECLGLGDFTGYPPFELDHVLRDLSDALAYFPNVRKVKRAPYYERMNRKQLLQTLARIPDLTYLSLLDYESTFVPTRGLEFAKVLAKRTAPNLKTVVCIPCPNGPMAVLFRCGKGAEGSSGDNISPTHGEWVERYIDLDEDSDL